MKETGKVVLIEQQQTGVNPRTGNTWALQGFVIETIERYPRKLEFSIFGEDKIQKAALRYGETIDVIGYPESHEYNGNWYTELRCTDICYNGVSRFNAPMMDFNNPPTPPESPA